MTDDYARFIKRLAGNISGYWVLRMGSALSNSILKYFDIDQILFVSDSIGQLAVRLWVKYSYAKY